MKTKLKQHTLGLAITPDTRNYLHLIEQALAVFGPAPDKGPKKRLVTDLTDDARELCRRRIAQHLTDEQKQDRSLVRAFIHRWCTESSVKLVDPGTTKLDTIDDWDAGMYATITDKGIGKLFDVRLRRPLFESWRVGGVWSGFLRIKDSPSIVFDLSDFDHPDWNSDKEMQARSIALAANQDTALLDDIVWPVPHNDGPYLCSVDQLKHRFRKNELAADHVAPCCVFINQEILTPDNYRDSELCNKKLNWLDFISDLFNRLKATMDQHRITVLDLQPIK